jgi:hypothetical protein
MSVKRQMEEAFNENRRRQARKVAIATGRDPVSFYYYYFSFSTNYQDKDKATVVEEISKPHLEPPQSGHEIAFAFITSTSLSRTNGICSDVTLFHFH